MASQTFNKQRIGVLLGACLGAVSMFLPWLIISAPGIISQHQNGFHNYGIGAFLSFVVSGILAFANTDRRPFFNRLYGMITLCAALIALLFTFIAFAFNNLGSIEKHAGAGIWLSLFAGSTILFSAWSLKKTTNDLTKHNRHIKQQISIPITNKRNGHYNMPPMHFSELERLIALKESGTITDEEYNVLKSMLT
jgi:hypothetical protein